MSVRAFERKFRSTFHLTPQKYLRKLQMRMAGRALVYSNQSVAEVALSCGFADQSHFTREFRRHFGRTPRDYREHYTRGAGAAAVPDGQTTRTGWDEETTVNARRLSMTQDPGGRVTEPGPGDGETG